MTQAMERLQRGSILCRLAQRLREAGSWCGQTHLQKAAFLLEEGRDVRLGYGFVLYKYGPFSVDVREELDELQADGFVRLEPQGHQYGARIGVAERGEQLLDHYSNFLGQFGEEIDEVVDFLGPRGVSALERLTTAVYLVKEDPEEDDEALAEELRKVKPHVSGPAAADAIKRARRFLDQTQSVG